MKMIDTETGHEMVEVSGHDKKEYASKGVAGTGLGLGIAGTALWLLSGGLGGGLFGNCAGLAVTNARVGELEKEIAVLRATRPYQDALIQAAIARVAEQAEFNLFRRTCRMISGEVVLPNTPTVTGYSSYDPCACRATTPAPSAN